MNNQAAQTMPELPEPAMPASSGGVEGNWEGDTYPDLYDAAQMHQYARDYAAALSQTAGVADGFVLVPREPSEAMLDAMHECIRIRCDPAKRTADIQNDREVWTAMLAAAPAASGVDTSTNEAWAARAQEKIEAMDAAASVSERARELFSAMLSAPYGDTTMGDIVCAETTRNRLESAWLPILEQALTQQREDGKLDG